MPRWEKSIDYPWRKVMPAGRATANSVVPCRFPTSAEIMFALHPGKKLLTSARNFRNTAQWNFHSPPCHLAKTYLFIEWTLTSQKQGMGNDWRFLHKGTDQNLQGTLAGFWGFSRFKDTIRPPIFMGQKSYCLHFFNLKNSPGPTFPALKKYLPPISIPKKSTTCPLFNFPQMSNFFIWKNTVAPFLSGKE